VRKPFVAGNWKMNGTRQDVAELISAIVAAHPFHCDTVVCPPSVFLEQVAALLDGSSIALGAQNVDWRKSGAYTGEVSVSMLKEFGCSYVLVGHSERRTLFHETDTEVAAKFAAAVENGLTPILCIGETLEQRKTGDTMQVVSGQLDAVLQELSTEEFAAGIVAYEPIWAIGTGETATPEAAGNVHADIRALLRDQAEELAQRMRILYGGSVNPANAAGLMAEQDIDGALVGGASLIGDDFVAICEATEAN
jgi:triosephosphate isomerase